MTRGIAKLYVSRLKKESKTYVSPMHDADCAMRYGGRFCGRVSCAGRESNPSK